MRAAAPDAIVMADTDVRIVKANAAAERQLLAAPRGKLMTANTPSA
jgi:hypothetical protein